MSTADPRAGKPSASGIERIVLCPGSWALEKSMPEEPKSEDAASGTLIHEALSSAIANPKLSPEENEMYETCERLCSKLVAYYVPPDAHNLRMRTETRLWLENDGFGVMSGQFDRLYIHRETGIVIDFKTGRNEVASAENNWQLRALAVMAAIHFGLKEVVVAIIQPWVSPQISVAKYSEKDLVESHDQLLHVLDSAHNSESERKAGAEQCRYCRAKTVCPEANQAIVTVAAASADTLPVERIPAFLDACEIAEPVIKAVKARAKALLADNPESVPGWGLKPTGSTRKLKDGVTVQNAFERFADIMPVQTFLTACDLSFGDTEALVRVATGSSIKDAKAETAKRLDGLIENKPKAPSLVRLSEPALNRGQQLFHESRNSSDTSLGSGSDNS